MPELTTRQGAALAAIRDHVDANHYPPSALEIAEIIGGSAQSARMLMLRLAALGYLRLRPGMPRACSIVEPAEVEPAA